MVNTISPTKLSGFVAKAARLGVLHIALLPWDPAITLSLIIVIIVSIVIIVIIVSIDHFNGNCTAHHTPSLGSCY